VNSFQEIPMVQNSTSLPEGAGATSSGNSTASNTQTYSSGGSQRSSSDRYESDYESSSRELVVTETSNRPSTATIVGAAIAGAVAGAAIPFMLSGRASSSSTGSSRNSRENAVVSESVIVNRPARELYDFWRNFENLSQFMDNIKSVQTLDQKRSHWVIKAPAGTSIEFDSRVVDDVPGRMISWESEEGASVPNRGRVEFIETSSGGGTNVRATISYDPPAGTAGRMVAKLFHREPAVQAREDLERFKRLMETGRADG
jgi:uncharacterized membrane protein